MPRTRKRKSLPVESRPAGLLKPLVESSTSRSTLVAYASMLSRSVAPMSDRNSFVNGEMLAGVSFSRALSRLPAVVLAAW